MKLKIPEVRLYSHLTDIQFSIDSVFLLSEAREVKKPLND